MNQLKTITYTNRLVLTDDVVIDIQKLILNPGFPVHAEAWGIKQGRSYRWSS